MVHRPRSLRIVATGAAFILPASALVAAIAQSGEAISDPKVREIVAIIAQQTAELAGKSDAAAGTICARLSASLIDLDAVAKVGAERIWNSMSSRQREAYRAAAMRWIVRKCVQQNHDNTGEKLEVIGLRMGESGDRLLAMRSREPQRFAIWRLRGAKQLRVADVVLDGVSMSLTLRDQTNALLDQTNNDIDATTWAIGR